MRLRTLIGTVLLAAVFVPTACTDKPDAQEIFAKVEQAVGAVKSLSYKGEARGEGTLRSEIPRVCAMVKLKDRGEERAPYIRIQGVIEPPTISRKEAFQVIVGESEVIAIDEENKRCLVGSLPEGMDLLIDELQLVLPRGSLASEPFAEDLASTAVAYEGQQTVAGTACHVLHSVLDDGKSEVRLYVGVNDFLPRRVERMRRSSPVEGSFVLEMRNLDASPEFDEGTFATTVPAGYMHKDYKRPEAAPPTHPTGLLLPVGSEAPDWTLKTPEGKPVSLSDLRGKVVVLDFWATWCAPCVKGMPTIQKLHEKFKDRPVRIFGVSTWERGDAAGFMKQKGFTYGLLLRGDRVAAKYNVAGIPALFVIGPDGKILQATSGFNPAMERQFEKQMEQVIEAALKDVEG